MLSFMRKNRQFLAKVLFLFFGLSFTQSIIAANNSGAQAAVVEPENPYSRAAKYYLPSLVKQEQMELEVAKKIKNENDNRIKEANAKNDTLASKFGGAKYSASVKIADLGSVETQKLVYQEFSKSTSPDKFKKTLLGDNAFCDLELFCGASVDFPEKNLFSQIDRTTTPFGKAKLQTFFTEKYNTIEQMTKKLQNRQGIVKHLVENESLFNELDQKLKEMSKNISQFMFLFKGLDETAQNSLNQFYFTPFGDKINTFFNENPLAYKLAGPVGMLPALAMISCFAGSVAFKIKGVDFGQQAKFLNNIFRGVSGIAALGLTYENVGALSKFLQGAIAASAMFFGHNLLSGNKLSLFNVMVTALFVLQFAQYFPAIKNWIVENPDYMALILFYVAILGGSAYFGYKSVESARDATRLTSLFIDNKVKDIAAFTKSMSDLGVLCAKDPLLGKSIKVDALDACLRNDGNIFAELSDLGQILQDSKLPVPETSVTSPSTYFSLTKERIFAAFKKMQRLNHSFIKSLKTIGRLDAYMSIARLYKEHVGHPAQYCFPNFVKNERPMIAIENVWLTKLDPRWVVTNNIKLAGQSVILTGPNAAGKSTALRSIISALILAQTIGIAPASKMDFTLFAKLNTHMNVADDEGRESLYQAEKNRVKSFLSELKELGKGEFEFAILDEMFSSTNPEEGQSAAYAIAKSLVKVPNCMCMLATHFKKLTELEVDTNGHYKNYKVYVDMQPDGTFKCPYKIVPGISNQNIAIAMMQHEFDADIVDEAYDVLSQIKEDTSDIVGFEQNKTDRPKMETAPEEIAANA